MMKAEDRVVFQEEWLALAFIYGALPVPLAGPEVSVLSL